MRVTMRTPRPLRSVLGFMDIKTGATIVVLFALLNKVAGIYGLIAIFYGGTLAQLSMYLYSVIALAGFAWGMKAITEEDAKRTFYFAHIFLADHLLNTIWTVFFAVSWWYYNPHDGQRIANSDAQKDMMDMDGPSMTAEERLVAAQKIWNLEKGHAAGVLLIGWLLKIYFAILIYSYAVHLRSGTYRSLPLTNPNPDPSSNPYPHHPEDDYELGNEDEDEDDFYHMPLRSGGLVSSSLAPDFITAAGNSSGSANPGRTRRPNGKGPAIPPPAPTGPKPSLRILKDLEAPMESVLWDEDEEDPSKGAEIATAAAPYAGADDSDFDAESERGDISAGAYGRGKIRSR